MASIRLWPLRVRPDHWLHNVQNCGGGDRRVHSISAILQYPQGCRRSKRLACGHHAIHTEDRRAAAFHIWSGTITVLKREENSCPRESPGEISYWILRQ